MTFQIKVFGFDSRATFNLPLDEARQVIGNLCTFESVEQIWVLNCGVFQEQISDAN